MLTVLVQILIETIKFKIKNMMKKLLLSFLVALMATTYVNAQSLSLSWEGNTLADTVVVEVDPLNTEATIFHAQVTNNSDDIINVKAIRFNVDVIEGTGNSFCFATQCYPPFLDTSAAYLPIPAGASSPTEDFKGEFTAYENIGTSLVKYKFFNVNDLNDTVQVVVRYRSYYLAVDESLANSITLSNAYPNPTHTTVNLDYSFDVNIDAATVKIVNLLGSVVKEVEMNQNANKLSIDVSNLNAGVYFYSVIVNNEIFQTKKLVIR